MVARDRIEPAKRAARRRIEPCGPMPNSDIYFLQGVLRISFVFKNTKADSEKFPARGRIKLCEGVAIIERNPREQMGDGVIGHEYP